jgi:hypothetical protein
MKTILRSALAAPLASIALAAILATSPASAAPLSYTQMSLINSWVAYSPNTRVASAAIDADGIVHLRGAIRQNADDFDVAFILPVSMRPNKVILVTTNLFNAAAGRLRIFPDGSVQVQALGSHFDAQQFTSLDGVSFSQN